MLAGISEEGETFDRYADSDQIYGVLARQTGDGLAALLDRLADRYGGAAADRYGGAAADRHGGAAVDRYGGATADRHGGTTAARPCELLLMARFLQAFPQLCGSVRTCLSATTAAHAQSNSAANAQQCQPAAAFSRLEALFLAASCRMFNLWIGLLLAELERQLGARISSSSNSSSSSSSMDLLGFFPAWDKISVQVGMSPRSFFFHFPAVNLMLTNSSHCFISFLSSLYVPEVLFLCFFKGIVF
jgi:hypothetical protein